MNVSNNLKELGRKVESDKFSFFKHIILRISKELTISNKKIFAYTRKVEQIIMRSHEI